MVTSHVIAEDMHSKSIACTQCCGAFPELYQCSQWKAIFRSYDISTGKVMTLLSLWWEFVYNIFTSYRNGLQILGSLGIIPHNICNLWWRNFSGRGNSRPTFVIRKLFRRSNENVHCTTPVMMPSNPQCIRPTSHNAPFCVHVSVTKRYTVDTWLIHIYIYIMGFVEQVMLTLFVPSRWRHDIKMLFPLPASPVDSPHKRPVMRKRFLFMTPLCCH